VGLRAQLARQTGVDASEGRKQGSKPKSAMIKFLQINVEGKRILADLIAVDSPMLSSGDDLMALPLNPPFIHDPLLSG